MNLLGEDISQSWPDGTFRTFAFQSDTLRSGLYYSEIQVMGSSGPLQQPVATDSLLANGLLRSGFGLPPSVDSGVRFFLPE